MGSKTLQASLWGKKPEDWAQIQEATGIAGYEYVLDWLGPLSNVQLLDIGCGSGVFCDLAKKKGADVVGIDATGELLAEAKKRAPAISFLEGDMESLPFPDHSFDVVCGFNSFQYAENIAAAFAEAKRVLKEDGWLVVMIWGNKEDCEAASYLKALGSCMPPPPPGAGGPFALTENDRLQILLKEGGFDIVHVADLSTVWDYPDKATAIRGLLAAGPAARAIGHSGFEKVYDSIETAVGPYIDERGHVVYKNQWRVVVASLLK